MKQPKFTIIERYFMSDVLRVLLAVTLVLALILLSNKLTRYLKNAATGDWPSDVILPLMGLSTIAGLVQLVPMAVFLAVIMAVGRFYKDNEMTVISSCGISQFQLYRPLGFVALTLALMMGVLSFGVIPHAKRAITYLIDRAEQTSEITGISPGRFQESNDGRRVIYVEKADDKSSSVEKIFVLSRRKDGTQDMVVAESAYQQTEEGTGDTLIYLNNGHRYTGTPGVTNFRVARFEQHWIRAAEGEQNSVRIEYESKPTMELLGSDHPFDRGEFHWRLAMVVSPLLFTLIGLPLGRLGQREGRYGRVMAGVLIYLIYFKLLQVGQILIENESMPAWIGLWWVHLGLAAYLAWSMYQLSFVKSGGLLARIRLARAK